MAQLEEYYKKNPNGRVLSERELFGISLGLIIGEQNDLFIDSLEIGDHAIALQKERLRKNWGISNRETALEFLDSRSGEGGQRHLFNKLLDICIDQECTEAEMIDFDGTEFEDCADEVRQYIENLEEVLQTENGETWLEDDLEMHADAWDFGRIVYVARVSFSLGYILEHEAWKYINKMLRLSENLYEDWEDYTTSYLLGRAMWFGNDEGGWNEEIMAFASGGILDKKSPWQKLDWSIINL